VVPRRNLWVTSSSIEPMRGVGVHIATSHWIWWQRLTGRHD
jgi:hypothetical protein